MGQMSKEAFGAFVQRLYVGRWKEALPAAEDRAEWYERVKGIPDSALESMYGFIVDRYSYPPKNPVPVFLQAWRESGATARPAQAVESPLAGLRTNREPKCSAADVRSELVWMLRNTGNMREAGDAGYLDGLLPDYWPLLGCLTLRQLQGATRDALEQCAEFPRAVDILRRAPAHSPEGTRNIEYGQAMCRLIRNGFAQHRAPGAAGREARA